MRSRRWPHMFTCNVRPRNMMSENVVNQGLLTATRLRLAELSQPSISLCHFPPGPAQIFAGAFGLTEPIERLARSASWPGRDVRGDLPSPEHVGSDGINAISGPREIAV